MSQSVRQLEPKALWNHFADLNAVPRPSKKEEQVIAFMTQFGESLGLETKVDAAGNVIIRKPATPGMESRVPIVMQSHLDMVHQKNNDTTFDFATQGIDMYIDGDWVKARGTTLGADNGLGVASIMTILASDDIPHPAIDALFTIDEETGMTGAIALQGGMLQGKILLNLDTEDDDELTIGCAGGIDVTATGSYKEESLPAGYVGRKITVKGLTGGHSGMDIHRGRGNANKLMNRLLWTAAHEVGIRIAGIEGGGLRNAIPRESVATVGVPAQQAEAFRSVINRLIPVITSEYQSTDPGITIEVADADTPAAVLPQSTAQALLNAVYSCPNGIYRMSPDIADLVQTSNNVARVEAKGGNYAVLCLTRSAVDSEKLDLAAAIEATFAQIGAQVTTAGSYPGWTPRPDAPIVSLMADTYRELFNAEPKVLACHAGLECGILGTNYPDMQMISFGPNIKGAHSPDERAQVSSLQKYWKLLLTTLERIPVAS